MLDGLVDDERGAKRMFVCCRPKRADQRREADDRAWAGDSGTREIRRVRCARRACWNSDPNWGRGWSRERTECNRNHDRAQRRRCRRTMAC